VLVCCIGAAIGITLALLIEGTLQAMLANRMPGFGLDGYTFLLGGAVALGTGLLSGIVPGLRAARLTAVGAIREVA
jgi:ABC-type antimicrobial peptide transport system permease subunit